MNKNVKRKVLCVCCSLISCTLFFVLQWGVYHYLLSNKKQFVSPVAEENTIIRLQNASQLRGDVLFMGSSLTERLLPQDNLTTLATPGSSFTASLALLKDPNQFKPGTVYVLEVNNMFSGEDPQILEKTRDWSFNYCRDSSHFSLAAKPTSLIVSLLYSFSSKDKGRKYEPFDDIVAVPEDTSTAPSLTEDEIQKWAALLQGIEQIKSRGGQICLVYMPLKVMSAHYKSSYQKGCKLANYLKLPLLNYQETDVFKYLIYTDSAHLKTNHEATRRFMRTIARDAVRHAVVPPDVAP
ncbi:MAG: hypothetical protein Q4C03_05720 [bacterium]|nr:hypothetical protein [bacterium]